MFAKDRHKGSRCAQESGADALRICEYYPNITGAIIKSFTDILAVLKLKSTRSLLSGKTLFTQGAFCLLFQISIFRSTFDPGLEPLHFLRIAKKC